MSVIEFDHVVWRIIVLATAGELTIQFIEHAIKANSLAMDLVNK
jgi:hypothetical protein